MLFQCGLNVGLIVEWRIVDNDERVRLQLWDQALLEPSGDEVMMATSGEGERGQPFFAALRHDEIDAPFFVITSDLAMHFRSAPCPAMRAVALCLKAALIHVNNILRAVFLDPFAQGTKVSHSGSGMTFSVARRFFYGSQAGEAPAHTPAC